MLSFKQFLLNELATPGTTPVPTGSASQSTWDAWNYNRRNQSAENGSTVTPPTSGTTPPTGTPTPQPPPPASFTPETNPNAPGPNTGLSGLDKFEDPNFDKRNKGTSQDPKEQEIYARGHAQGTAPANTKFSRGLQAFGTAAIATMPGAEALASGTGRLSGLGYSKEGLLDRINAFKDRSAGALELFTGMGSGIASGLFGNSKTLNDFGTAGANELATLAAAATYDPRAAGAGNLKTPQKEGQAIPVFNATKQIPE